MSPIKDEQGKVVGASKILRDISHSKRLEQSLLRAEKLAATGRVAATIAHEINNPLGAVMNLLYLLRPTIAGEEGLGYLATAESELERVSHIAKQTLGYYREHASATPASLSDIVRHAITIYEPRCRASGIQIRQSVGSLRKLVLRPGEMMQVISNVLTNSVYAISGGGAIEVGVRDCDTEPRGVALTLRDNGVGIGPEDLPRLFDAFFTAHAQSALVSGSSSRNNSLRGMEAGSLLRAAGTRKNMARRFVFFFLSSPLILDRRTSPFRSLVAVNAESITLRLRAWSRTRDGVTAAQASELTLRHFALTITMLLPSYGSDHGHDHLALPHSREAGRRWNGRGVQGRRYTATPPCRTEVSAR